MLQNLLTTGKLIANSGWDHILSAYVSFGFLLLDHRVPSAPFAKSKSAILSAEAVHQCAYKLLTTSFVNQRECRSTVLKGILSRVMSNNAKPSILLLQRLVSEQTTIVVSMQEHFKESLEYLPLLPVKTAMSFLDGADCVELRLRLPQHDQRASWVLSRAALAHARIACWVRNLVLTEVV